VNTLESQTSQTHFLRSQAYRTDEELVKACREGDESAWEEIVFKYQKLMYSIPRHAGLSKDLAADVLQDVMTTLFQKLDVIEKPEFLRAWLMTTTRHKTIHLIARETKGRPIPIDDENSPAMQVADRTPLADEVLVKLERESRVDAAFEKLDDRCRRLLTMLYVEGEKASYNDVVTKLNVPLGSIGPTRARCLQKLIKLVDE
jgi:RNA polymerase sigma factor (sigma-70 family)